MFNTTLQNTLYEGVAQGFNQDIFIWNAALGYKFLKDKSLEIRASVNDILNQNSGISRTITGTYVEDDRTQVIRRYLLLTATYTLKYYKKGWSQAFVLSNVHGKGKSVSWCHFRKMPYDVDITINDISQLQTTYQKIK